VTRGLIALANDKAELASVLAHEMGHVIARHAQIRAEQARQAAIVGHVVSDVLSDPQIGALALAKSKLTLAIFSRAQEFEADGIGVGITARAGLDPYGASRILTDMERNAEIKSAGSNADPRAADFLSTHPATPERVKNALANARQFSGPGNGERDRVEYLASVDGMVYGEDPSEGFVRGRRFLHPKLAFTFLAPPGFTLDNTAQAVLGIKDGGDEAMRLDIVSVPPEQSLIDYLKSGWLENVDALSAQDVTVNGLPLYLRGQDQNAGDRSLIPRNDGNLPPTDPKGSERGAAAAPEDRHRRRQRHGGEPGAADGERRSPGRALPRAQRPRRPRRGQAGAEGQAGGRVALSFRRPRS
jgi:predicted Zn-dependent protease